MIRLATTDDTISDIKDVIRILETKTKEYIFWGNPIASECDYLFIHSQGDSTIEGVLKIRCVKARQDISKEEFSAHRPDSWGSDLNDEKYFVVEGAKPVHILLGDLKDGDGNPKKSNTMHDMSFVDSDKFQPF